MARTCTQCGISGGAETFHRSGRSPDGLHAWCKRCLSKRNKKAARENPGMWGRYKSGARRSRSQFIADLKSDRGCMFCRERHPACLEFHHRDPDHKHATVSQMRDRAATRERIEAEIAKCDVLCSNCHRKLHYVSRSSHYFTTEVVAFPENTPLRLVRDEQSA
jgi:hypothetical protein